VVSVTDPYGRILGTIGSVAGSITRGRVVVQQFTEVSTERAACVFRSSGSKSKGIGPPIRSQLQHTDRR
jgi:hypothetical protein